MGGHTGQVAAKVNGDEITVSQVNYVLSQLGPAARQHLKLAQRKALNTLIDVDLLSKKALQQKLDRDPQVLQALQYAKQQVLAQAYMGRVLQQAGVGKPGASQIQDYYDKHPGLFSNRRVYHLRLIRIEETPDTDKAVRKELAHARTIDELTGWLKSHRLRYSTRDETEAAEGLPLGLLPKLDPMRKGDIIDISTGPALQALQLVSYEEQPLSRDQAAPLIERYLINRKRMDLAQAHIKKLRDSAKIELLGAFKGMDTGQSTGVAGITTPQQDSQGHGSDFMNKGLSGLK